MLRNFFLVIFTYVYIASYIFEKHLSIYYVDKYYIIENRFPVLLDVVAAKVHLEQRKVVKKPIKRHLHLPLPFNNPSNLCRTIKSLQAIAAI